MRRLTVVPLVATAGLIGGLISSTAWANDIPGATYNGSTSNTAGGSISFTVSADGSGINSVTITDPAGPCSFADITQNYANSSAGPLPIVNHSFSDPDPSFEFAGSFPGTQSAQGSFDSTQCSSALSWSATTTSTPPATTPPTTTPPSGTPPSGTPPPGTPPTGPGVTRIPCVGGAATIVGTEGNDVLNGTSRKDVIAGLGGDDKIFGLGAGDLICGGSGNDTLNGGKGVNALYGGTGNDLIVVSTGPGTRVNDAWKGSGGPGNDTLRAGKGEVVLYGDAGNDTLKGSKGNDKLNGGPGKDLCKGGKGNDTASKCEVEKSIQASSA